MSPDAEAEARFMRMAKLAGLRDCGCRVSDHHRFFTAWAHGEGQRDPFTVEQTITGGSLTDEQIAAAIADLRAMIAERGEG